MSKDQFILGDESVPIARIIGGQFASSTCRFFSAETVDGEPANEKYGRISRAGKWANWEQRAKGGPLPLAWLYDNDGTGPRFRVD